MAKWDPFAKTWRKVFGCGSVLSDAFVRALERRRKRRKGKQPKPKRPGPSNPPQPPPASWADRAQPREREGEE